MLTALLLLLVALAQPLAAQLSEPHVVRGNVTPCLNVRPDPDASVDPIACLPPGTAVTVTDAIPYWREVRLADGRSGWAAKKYLEPSAAPVITPATTSIPANAFLEIHFVDVGQGDAIWIHTHDDGVDGNGRFEGRNILIDGGPNSSDQGNRFLRYLEERAHHDAVIDAAILSHPHDDHYPGLDGVRRHFDIHRYYDTGFPKQGSDYAAYLAAMRAEMAGGQPIQAMVGMGQFDNLAYLGSEVSARFLHAWPGDADDGDLGSSSTLENNASLVLRLQYGSHVFLFMGDAEGKDRGNDPAGTPRYVEARLLNSVPPADLRATVLKLAHHGSETSSTLDFLRAVNPEVIVIQSGRRAYSGRFLPDASVIARYCQNNPNVQVYRTDQNDEAEGLTASNDEDGDHVVIRSNGQTLQIQAFEGGQPFTPAGCD